MLNLWKNILCLFFNLFICQVLANDLEPISRVFFSNIKYEKYIEVKTYLVTKEQIAKLFSKDDIEITQKINKELFGREIFLLVRCKNFGEYKAFGIVNCRIGTPGTGGMSIEIKMLPSFMKIFYDSVLHMPSGIVPNDDKTPTISYEWKSLCTM